jgi:chromosome segregation ATPase
METTQSLYRFKGNVPAGKSAKLVVKEEIVQGEAIAILPTDISGIQLYAQTGEIPQPVRDALTKAIQLKEALADTERQINEKVQQLSDNSAEQGRVRENLRTLTQQQSQPYQRQLTKLNDIESAIEKLQSERDALIKTRDTQRKALEDYLNTLNIG